MGRAPCCSKVGLHRGAWSDEENKLLTDFIQTHGEGQWRSMPSKAGLLRCGKSCRLRWMNYLRPGIKRGSFTADENDIIIRLQSVHGNRWSFIASELSGRTDNEIKNHWNTHLKQNVQDGMGENQPEVLKKKKKPKKNKRKTDQKSKKLKTIEKPEDIVPQNSSSKSQSQSQSALVSLRKDEGFDNGLMSGASSSSTIDQRDDDLLNIDFSRPNWSSLFEMEGGATSMDELLDMPLDRLDLMMMNHDETEMLQKLYDECLHLL